MNNSELPYIGTKAYKNISHKYGKLIIISFVFLILIVVRIKMSVFLFETESGYHTPRQKEKIRNNILRPTLAIDNWVHFIFGGTEGKINIIGENIVFTVYKSDGIDWHLQCAMPQQLLKDNTHYRLSFRARTDAPHRIQVLTPSDCTNIDVGYSWRDYQFTFKTKQVNKQGESVPAFNAGAREGRVWITNLRLVEVK